MKEHQSSNTQYQVRVDGVTVYWPSSIDADCLKIYARYCAANPESYVDIVSIRTEILVNQGSYHQMQKHFVGES